MARARACVYATDRDQQPLSRIRNVFSELFEAENTPGRDKQAVYPSSPPARLSRAVYKIQVSRAERARKDHPR